MPTAEFIKNYDLTMTIFLRNVVHIVCWLGLFGPEFFSRFLRRLRCMFTVQLKQPFAAESLDVVGCNTCVCLFVCTVHVILFVICE